MKARILKERLEALMHRVKANRKTDAMALKLAREIQGAELKVFEVRLVALERTVAQQGVRMALWAGLGAGVAYFVGAATSGAP